MNNNIQVHRRKTSGTWDCSNQEFDASVDRLRVVFANKRTPGELSITR